MVHAFKDGPVLEEGNSQPVENVELFLLLGSDVARTICRFILLDKMYAFFIFYNGGIDVALLVSELLIIEREDFHVGERIVREDLHGSIVFMVALLEIDELLIALYADFF